MNTCDNFEFLRRAALSATNLGFLHVQTGTKKFNGQQLLGFLASNLGGQFSYRRFQEESLKRAYGVAFTCAAKLARTKQVGVA